MTIKHIHKTNVPCNQHKLNVITWNVRGIMSSAASLSQTLDVLNIDIALITEHKLLPYMSYFMDSIHLNYYNHTLCDSSFDVYGSIRCGKAGVAILYKKNLKFSLRILDEIQDEKITGIELTLKDSSKLFFICTYMPAANYSNVEYENVLNTLQAALDTYSEQGIVAIAGDLNAEIIPKTIVYNNFRDKCLSKFVDNNSLLSLGMYNNNLSYTFKTAEKMLDHILIHEYNLDIFTKTQILDDDIFDVSDHLPILTTIEINFESLPEIPKTEKIAWHKIDKDFTESYQNKLSLSLKNIDYQDINSFYNDIVSKVAKSANETLPKTKYNKHVKPYWREAVRIAHRNQRIARRRWISEGRPRGNHNESYKCYKQLKRNFINSQKQAIKDIEYKFYEDLEKNAECDNKTFWSLVKQRKNKKAQSCSQIESETGITREPSGICDRFCEFYSEVYTPLESEHFDNDFKAFVENECKIICDDNKTYNDTPKLNSDIRAEDIEKVVRSLKNNKASSFDNIYNEHLKLGRSLGEQRFRFGVN